MKGGITLPSTGQSLIQLWASSHCPHPSRGLFTSAPSAQFPSPPVCPSAHLLTHSLQTSSLLVITVQLLPLHTHLVWQNQSSVGTPGVTHSEPSGPLHRGSPFILPRTKGQAAILNKVLNSHFEGEGKKAEACGIQSQLSQSNSYEN